MAQYVTKHLRLGIRSVLDFVDVDSHKWGQYAARKPWPWNRVYRRESRVLGDFERTVATLFGASVFVSSSEAALFRARTGLPASRITHINNGVDADYFSAERNYPNPYSPGEKILVFTGAMDYWPNVDAVCWFAGEIFPEILQREPGARFYIVGARPTPAVRDLSRDPGVCVTGTVEDIRPYLAHARAAVAPLRIAQGVQNKVLEGMAMAKPVLATTLAMEGIEPCPGLTDRVADTPQAMQEEALLLLQGETNLQRGALGRQWVLQRYDWSRNLEGLVRLLEEQAVTM
jgi:sugar transferase (PEP-CTERM/EpsH1 system associated)